MSMEYRFIEPLDVLFLRGNKLFGDPGSFGECLVPPWPSVAAGAIRSRILVDDGVDLAAFAGNRVNHPYLGTPEKPGSFSLSGFYLARRQGGEVELLMQPPADLVISKDSADVLTVERLQPQPLPLASSYPLPMLPVLSQANTRSKPEAGYWLMQTGWESYLQGGVPSVEQLVHSAGLWSLDARIGIGMSSSTRSVEEGKLFSAQALVMQSGVGFVAAVQGAQVPVDGLLRLGGDGRGALLESISFQEPAVDYAQVCAAKRCCLVLTSPGVFASGWQLLGMDDCGRISLPGGITARVVSAAVSRAEVLSGWDLAAWQPKSAQLVVPTGSVYWLDDLQATPEALAQLVEQGLWMSENENPQRRAEGFNRLAIGHW